MNNETLVLSIMMTCVMKKLKVTELTFDVDELEECRKNSNLLGLTTKVDRESNTVTLKQITTDNVTAESL